MPQSDRSSPIRARLLAVLAVMAACVLITACGGSAANQNAASGANASETKLANYARCLREHGLHAEVATLLFGARGLKIGGGKEPAPGVPVAAKMACARYQPEPQTVNFSPQQKVEREEAVRKFAKCMREHGIEVEASSKNGHSEVLLQGHPGSDGPNPESPGFQQAQSACQKLVQKAGP